MSGNVPIDTFLECVWVTVKCDFSQLLIGVFYRPPNMSPTFSEEFQRILCVLVNRFPNYILLIFGDFNFPCINWPILSAAPTLTEEHCFLQTCLDFSLTQLITNPTRKAASSANILDLFLTNHPAICLDLSHMDGLSDHDIIIGNLSVLPKKGHVTNKYIRCYKKANFDIINSELLAFSNEFLAVYSRQSVEENWTWLKNTLINLIDMHIPVAKIKCFNSTPWFNDRLRRFNNKKKRLYRNADKNRLSESWKRYHLCEKAYQSLLKTTRRNFFGNDLPSLLINNPRRFWRVLNPRSHPEIALTNLNGEFVSDSESAQLLNNAFSSVFTREDLTSSPLIGNRTDITMPAITIREGGICSLLNNLKLSSASDHIGLNNKILKNISPSLSPILCALFSQSLTSHTIPHDWRVARVVPIFKSGDRSLPLNYRPISLTNTICKLLEHVIYTQIINYLEEHSIIFKQQHGFRKGYSCDTQLAGFAHDLHSALDSGFQVDAIFLDYSKAFDRVPHHRLILKLTQLNIHPDIISWIKEFLSHRTQYTVVNNSHSTYVNVTSGVPQGSVLGPLLFLIYINDLPNNVSSRIRLFADDCVLYRNISSNTDRELLQSDLDSINTWCSTWLMSLNESKTKLMSFTQRSARIPTSYALNNVEIELATTYKYLGIHFQSDLAWHYHTDVILAAANRSLGFIKHSLKNAPPHIRKLAYVTLVRPKIEYASAIWEPLQAYLIQNIESLQNRAVRFIFSDYSRHSSITALRDRAELESLSHRRQAARLSLFHKLYHHPILSGDLFQAPAVTFPRRDHQYKVKRPTCHTHRFANSFIPRTIIEWNHLPSHVATETNIAKFQELLRTERIA